VVPSAGNAIRAGGSEGKNRLKSGKNSRKPKENCGNRGFSIDFNHSEAAL
jgi:hypothetical protein